MQNVERVWVRGTERETTSEYGRVGKKRKNSFFPLKLSIQEGILILLIYVLFAKTKKKMNN